RLETKASRGSPRSHIAPMCRPSGRVTVTSFIECTARSTRDSTRASSSSLRNSPLPPEAASGTSRVLSPWLTMPTSSTSIAGQWRRRRSATKRACHRARALRRVPMRIGFIGSSACSGRVPMHYGARREAGTLATIHRRAQGRTRSLPSQTRFTPMMETNRRFALTGAAARAAALVLVLAPALPALAQQDREAAQAVTPEAVEAGSAAGEGDVVEKTLEKSKELMEAGAET